MPSSKKKRTNKFTKARELAISDSVPISNRFSARNDDEMDVNDLDNSEPTASHSEASQRKDKPPPIIIHLPTKWQVEIVSLRELPTLNFSGEYLKILPKT